MSIPSASSTRETSTLQALVTGELTTLDDLFALRARLDGLSRSVENAPDHHPRVQDKRSARLNTATLSVLKDTQR
jgi:hypothetical protein